MAGNIEEAMAFALKAHKGQKRKGSDTPYIFHPIEVAQIVLSEHGDEDTVVAALLHDVLEDTAITARELAAGFNVRVCELVGEETEDKSLSWDRRKESAIHSVEESEDMQLKLLVLADKLSNLRAMERDLEECGSALWERFNEKDPKRHEWYYRMMGEALRALENCRAYLEYSILLEKVFGREDE